MLALVVLGFALSIISAWKLGVHSPTQLLWDDHIYYSIGQSILRQHEFAMDGRLATFWPPAYPVLLALIAFAAGPGVWPIYIVQSLLYAGALYLIFRTAFALTSNERLAVLTLAFCVLFIPFYTNMTSQVMSEGLALPVTAAAFCAFVLAVRKGTTASWVMAGVLFGLGGLTRPPILAAGLAAAACVALLPRLTRRSAAGPLTLAIAAFVTLLPWLFRGYVVTGGFVPISAQGPYNFYLGNAPEYYATGDVRMDWFNYHRYSATVQKPSKALNQAFIREGLVAMKQDPPRAAGFMVRKFTQLWMGDLGRPPVTSRFGSDRIIHGWGVPRQVFICSPVLILAVLGWFTMEPEARRRLNPLLWAWAAYTLAYVVLYTEMRYSFPMYPYVLLLAAAGVLRLFGKGSRPQVSKENLPQQPGLRTPTSTAPPPPCRPSCREASASGRLAWHRRK